MLVTEKAFPEVIKTIHKYKEIAVDTETTGLFPYAGDKLFGISVSTKDESYYFDYNSELQTATLSREKSPIANILNGYDGVVNMHNAKFDMAFLANEGVAVEELKINCTYAVARIVDNSENWLTLDHLTRKLGHNKSDEVKKHILKHKLYEWIQRPGKKKREKNLFFYKVPLEVVQPYAEKDTEATLALADHQFKSIRKQNGLKGLDIKLDNLLQNERRLTKVFYRMERRGIKVDVRFGSDGYAHETKKYTKLADEFKKLTGKDFIDSGVLFAIVFKEKGIPYPTTAKGNPCFDSDALKNCDHPLASIIKGYRDSYKKAGTFENILYYTYEDVLHSNARQAGCTTGRVSYSDPPMQCLEKVEEDDPSYKDKYLIRRCFVPRENYKLFMLDYDQMEYRMMLNYAGQLDLIEKIKGGLDVHTATAEMMGVPRKQAKTINFMLLYGGGSQKLADALGVSLDEAKWLKEKYFSVLPKVKSLVSSCQSVVTSRGIIHNWFGRRYHIDSDFCYKAPNYLIQGGCADWIKVAMVNIDNFLKDKKSKMLLQVHDELLFEVHKDEEEIVPILKYIMESVSYEDPHLHLPYTVGVDWSDKNWQDKQPWEG